MNSAEYQEEAEGPTTEYSTVSPSHGTIIRRRVTLVIALSLSVVLGGLWWLRAPIVEHFVQQQLAARNVRASYSITQIALRTQRIENLVLGDPARPDLTARSVEVDIDYAGLFPHVEAIRARGVRLYAKVDDKGLHLGELDKFRDPASTEPLSLPDIKLTLDDARARLETPIGPVGLSLRGRGGLRDGFSGQVAALVRDARLPMEQGCFTPVASAYLDLKMADGAPRFVGPVRAETVRCGDIGVARVALQTELALDAAFEKLSGRVEGGAQAARASGATLAKPHVQADFAGGMQALTGQAQFAWAGARHASAQVGGGRISGGWRWNAAGADAGFAMPDARFDMRRVQAFDASALARMAAGARSTPVGPLADRLARGLAGLQQDNRVSGRFGLTQKAGGAWQIVVSAFSLTGRRGENLALGDGGRFQFDWPQGRWRLDGGLSGRGGDLPELALRLRPEAGGGVSGQMFMQPYEAGTNETGKARLELEPVRFAARGDGVTRVTTKLRLDGPLPGGALQGLSLPIDARVDARGNWVLNPGCTPLSFASLSVSGLTLAPRSLSLCGGEGGALASSRGGRLAGGGVLHRVDLAGRLGTNPVRFAAESGTLSLSAMNFALTGADLRIGDGASPVRLSAARLEGRQAAGGIGGDMHGVEAKIGAVPLLVEEGSARWGFASGALALDGRILVLDDASPDRFNPVEARDFALRMANGQIRATGTLTLPGRERSIAKVTVGHDLARGTGRADFTVDGLRFDSQLQPDEITHIALGVIANVQGVVNGAGQIGWRGDTVTSSGAFSTEGMNLAAAFGPVQGLSATIRLTDLLGLVSEPEQEVRLATVHPGVEVRDGVIRYQLLPGYRVAVDSGRWPLAGGELLLLPTVMDMSAERARNLTFRVIGLEAGAFIDLLDLENVSATGTFDGLLPMVFDAQGGRIVGGVLAARQYGLPPLIVNSVQGLEIPCDPSRQAGRLSYVGQVSNENLGTAGKMAFDALKDLHYKCLTILMDGAIDGELVTQVVFNGVNRGELSSVPKVIAKKFIGLPFLFNIRIQAPFRGLMSTAQSFIDPTLLIRDQMSSQLKANDQNAVVVQPRASDDVPDTEAK